ncbi:MAG: hypothetical protein HXS48_08280 [Theionarchaea archaeon]|nr:MAG: hypothetical protein AYK19_17080 [Theionarchaea archaeon DG-70-1]MBU7026925.1 hypothetical protein [Theionarchaea archaeon]
MNEETNDKNSVKNESSVNPYNLEEIKINSEVEENQLIDQYDEETVLKQIPEDDTLIEDVLKKFKNPNKVTYDSYLKR